MCVARSGLRFDLGVQLGLQTVLLLLGVRARIDAWLLGLLSD